MFKLTNSARNAAARIFPCIEPARSFYSYYYEAIGRVIEASTIADLEKAGRFIDQNGVLNPHKTGDARDIPALEALYASRAEIITTEALAGNKAPLPGESMEVYFARLSAVVPQVTALAAIPCLPRRPIGYSRAISLNFIALGMLHVAESYAEKGHRTNTYIDSAGRFIVYENVRETVGPEKCQVIVDRYDDIVFRTRSNMMTGARGGTVHDLPRTLAQIKADIIIRREEEAIKKQTLQAHL